MSMAADKNDAFHGNRSVLHGRIAKRFEQMLEQGLVAEVEQLLISLKGNTDSSSARIVGYRQVIEFLQEEVSEEQMIANGVAATRQLAKRQLTWLRQQRGVTWFEATDYVPVEAIVQYMTNVESLKRFDLAPV